MMVGLGSAMFTMVSLRLYQASQHESSPDQFDLMRIIAGIIGGIGFLGAGTIIQFPHRTDWQSVPPSRRLEGGSIGGRGRVSERSPDC